MSNNSFGQQDVNLPNNDNQKVDKYVFIQQLFDAISENDNSSASQTAIIAEIDDLLHKQVKQSQTLLEDYSSISLLESLESKQDIQLSAPFKNVISLLDNLFDFILNDKNLRLEIIDLIARLRVPFLKLSLIDNSVFLDQSHPARILLNEMSKVGLLWEVKDSKTNLIKEQINKVTAQILKASIEQDLASLFETACEQFTQFSSSLIKRTEIFEKRIREAEHGRAKAKLAQSRADQALNQIINKQNTPEFVQKLIHDAWKHVVYLELLKSGDNDQSKPIVSINTAKQLLVSLQPLNSVDELDKFLELQPILLDALKNGLEKTSYSFAETDAFMEELDSFHTNLVMQVQTFIEKEPEEEILRLKPADPFDMNQEDHSSETQQQIEPIENVDVEKMSLETWTEYMFNRLPENSTDNEIIIENIPFRQEKDAAASKKLIKLLKPGRWFDIEMNGDFTRCKLATYLDQTDQYIFVSGSGAKIAELDSETLIDYYQNKHVIILDNTPLFERAYGSVIDQVVATHLKQQALKRAEEEAELEKLKKQQEEARLAAEKARLIAEQKAQEEEQKQVLQVMESLSHLTVGSWVEIQVDNVMKKCRLAAKIASSGKMIFADRTGVKVKECSLEELAIMYRADRLQLKQKNDLFDQALASVISNVRNLKSERS
ncbi:DUF1631 domain-containing protein [Aliikangiella coralliicola]|uniref:DUF1631 domain-containing protein n=2 Tax=Aliikangiella coralliicola TaxID=2592383 RepID=A0A545U0C8_9GAMM|nr:DUF1631 family protein [Aliikangiella coralliicola]TQV82921.1 DUF1631 domain-containing protein [Aliikangiella coralliicola]